MNEIGSYVDVHRTSTVVVEDTIKDVLRKAGDDPNIGFTAGDISEPSIIFDTPTRDETVRLLVAKLRALDLPAPARLELSNGTTISVGG